jgi:hypothetical protein
MSANSDKLGQMVTGFTSTSENLSGSLVKIDAQILDLTQQWQAIGFAEDEIETDLEAAVVPAKAEYFYTYGNFGVSGTGALNEWSGYDEETGITGLTYISGTSFTVDGNQTSTFTAGLNILVTNSGTFSASTTISGSDAADPAYPSDTYVVLDAAICSASLDGVYLEAYAPSGPFWDSDVTIQGYMDDWVFLDNFLTQTVGLDGTYGIVGRLSNLYVARGVVENDYAKYDGMISPMSNYAT